MGTQAVDEDAFKAAAQILDLLGSQRQDLRDRWTRATARIDATSAQLGVVDRAFTAWRDKTVELLDRSRKVQAMDLPPSTPFPGNLVDQVGPGKYELGREITEVLNRCHHIAASLIPEIDRRAFAGRYWRQLEQTLSVTHGALEALQSGKARIEASLQSVIEDRKRSLSEAVSNHSQKLSLAHRSLIADMASVSAPMQAWSERVWVSWTPATESDQLLAGAWRPEADNAIGPHGGYGCDLLFPRFVSVHGTGWWFRHSTDPERGQVISAVTSLLLRCLAATEPGKARLTVFDPFGLGQSAASFLELREYDPAFLSGKVWSSTSDLRRMLSETTSHIEDIIQKYLRTHYNSIEDYNRDAGEVAEPYRYLVIYDFPSGFDEETHRELCRIIENGPRCGVHTIVAHNATVQAPYGIDISVVARGLTALQERLHVGGRGNAKEGTWLTFLPEVAPSDALRDQMGPVITNRIIDGVGHQGRHADRVVVHYEKLFSLLRSSLAVGIRSDLPVVKGFPDPNDPTTWWAASSERDVTVPVGQSGARDIALLRFDSETSSGALLVGRPGSGKSTLLHTFIAMATTLYSPAELQFHLIDFKEGVEFKGYAAQALPHARSVAIESDREFGLSVLASIDAELERRGHLFRATGGERANLETYRQATGVVLPRIILVFDEFHVLFTQNDKLGSTAAHLLEKLVRQGRGFGIHMILGSQSLSGLDAIGRHVLQLLPIRIVLPAAEADASLALGEGNDAGRHLTRRGEGILNTMGGTVEANLPFQGAFLDESRRIDRLKVLRKFAESTGFGNRPVVFEGDAPLEVNDHPASAFVSELRQATAVGVIPVRLGRPMTVDGTADIALRRESGANIALVAREHADVPHAALAMATVCASLGFAQRAQGVGQIDVIDFTSIDEGVEDLLLPFMEQGLVRVGRRRDAASRMAELAQEAERRSATDDFRALPRLVVLFGVHRARDLDPDATDFDAQGPSLSDLVVTVLRDGPEVGIHTLLWVDTVSNLNRRISRSAVRDIAWWVLGPMGRDDSMAIADNDIAANLRTHQAAIVNNDTGFQRRITVFARPDLDWLRSVIRG